MTDVNYPKPWDILNDETDRMYELFRMFLMMQSRTYPKVAEQAGVSLQYINDLGRRFDWQNRAKKYDAWIYGQMDKDRLDALKIFQAQVVTEEVEDYQRMRKLWQDAMSNMEGVQFEGVEDFSKAMRQMAQTRLVIDQMARKAATLPNTYKQGEMPKDTNPNAGPLTLTMNGPKALPEGEDDNG